MPYADYVNVGTSNRNASWLTIPADKVSTSEEKCTETTSEGTLDHHYDATDAESLAAAFAGIAAKLSQVRLTR